MEVAQPKIVSMELAEFVAKIVLDVFDGVHATLRLQEERQVEMAAAAASLDAAEFARLTVPVEEFDRELARLVPSPDPHRPHGLYVGAPYHPALKEGETESPPFRTLFGIQLEGTDYIQPRRSKSFVLAKTAVDKIRGAVRMRLGAEAQSILRSTLSRGVPRVIVDSGKINARLFLTLQTATQPSPDGAVVVPSKDARLLVRMVDDRAPQNQQLRVDSLSELEIRFKTVT
jgi:hypothetical protein